MDEHERRIEMERRMVRCLVRELLSHGFKVGNWNEEWLIEPCRDEAAILADTMVCDIEWMSAYDGDRHVGTVMLVYGNDGWDVCCDYHTSLEPYLTRTMKLADRFQGRFQ